jgi:hypothetical protein
MISSRQAALLQALGVVLTGLAGRALIDKLLAVRGGVELVAHWAQISSLADTIAGVTLAGIGVGLTGLVALKSLGDQRQLLGDGLRLGLLVSGACLAACALLIASGGLPLLPPAQSWLALPALLAGWLTVAPGLLSFWLLGRGQPQRAMLLAAMLLVIPVVALALAAAGQELPTLLAAQTAVGLVLTVLILRKCGSWASWQTREHELRPFIFAGLAIGIFSPLATAFARQRIGDAASWETAGAVQALWRSSEWITAIAAGLIQAHYLPRLAAARGAAAFRQELRASAMHVVVPALLGLGLLWLLLPQALALLYRADLPVTRLDALPFFIGDALRMASWIFLFGLFARGAGRAVTLGEFLSLPLFALLLWLLPDKMTLPMIGLCWILSYAAYGIFNALALRCTLESGDGEAGSTSA